MVAYLDRKLKLNNISPNWIENIHRSKKYIPLWLIHNVETFKKLLLVGKDCIIICCLSELHQMNSILYFYFCLISLMCFGGDFYFLFLKLNSTEESDKIIEDSLSFKHNAIFSFLCGCNVSMGFMRLSLINVCLTFFYLIKSTVIHWIYWICGKVSGRGKIRYYFKGANKINMTNTSINEPKIASTWWHALSGWIEKKSEGMKKRKTKNKILYE